MLLLLNWIESKLHRINSAGRSFPSVKYFLLESHPLPPSSPPPAFCSTYSSSSSSFFTSSPLLLHLLLLLLLLPPGWSRWCWPPYTASPPWPAWPTSPMWRRPAGPASVIGDTYHEYPDSVYLTPRSPGPFSMFFVYSSVEFSRVE